MNKVSAVAIAVVLILSAGMFAAERHTPSDYWQDTALKVHASFTGREGTFAHFGDSITVTLAFWAPLLYEQKNMSPEMERAYGQVREYMRKECWRDWKGTQYGNEGRMTIRWAHKNVDNWLKKLNPEAALLMFGTNDLNSVPLDEYRQRTQQVIKKCLDNGTVVILSTIPPRHGFEDKAAIYAGAVRRIAEDMKIPLIDFYSEILKRRPNDWDGASDTFSQFKGYDVPTLIARDGVHPSNPKQYQDDYSDKGLASSGFALRNYLSLMKYAEVTAVLNKTTPPPNNRTVEDESSLISPPVREWFPKAPVLADRKGARVIVSNPKQLAEALESATAGSTIVLEDGLYFMDRYVEIHTDNVTLRSASGDPRRVVIDGIHSQDGELIGIRGCVGVTIANITIQNIKWNGFKINSETGVHDLTIYNCMIHNIWQRGIKGVKVPLKDREKIAPRNCRISYCLFYNDRPKQFQDDPADTPGNFGGNYIGGIDVMFARNWVISDNVFVNIQGRTRESRGAIFLWHDTRGCVVERNIIIDCDAGICLGNPHKPKDVVQHCSDCYVANNFVTRATEGGIVAIYTRNCRIVNNSIYEPDSRLRRLIRVVFDNDDLYIANNLLCGPGISNESSGQFTAENNPAKDVTYALVDPEGGNLHLTKDAADAIDKAIQLRDVPVDIDGTSRGAIPDIGADEL